MIQEGVLSEVYDVLVESGRSKGPKQKRIGEVVKWLLNQCHSTRWEGDP